MTPEQERLLRALLDDPDFQQLSVAGQMDMLQHDAKLPVSAETQQLLTQLREPTTPGMQAGQGLLSGPGLDLALSMAPLAIPQLRAWPVGLALAQTGLQYGAGVGRQLSGSDPQGIQHANQAVLPNLLSALAGAAVGPGQLLKEGLAQGAGGAAGVLANRTMGLTSSEELPMDLALQAGAPAALGATAAVGGSLLRALARVTPGADVALREQALRKSRAFNTSMLPDTPSSSLYRALADEYPNTPPVMPDAQFALRQRVAAEEQALRQVQPGLAGGKIADLMGVGPMQRAIASVEPAREAAAAARLRADAAQLQLQAPKDLQLTIQRRAAELNAARLQDTTEYLPEVLRLKGEEAQLRVDEAAYKTLTTNPNDDLLLELRQRREQLLADRAALQEQMARPLPDQAMDEAALAQGRAQLAEEKQTLRGSQRKLELERAVQVEAKAQRLQRQYDEARQFADALTTVQPTDFKTIQTALRRTNALLAGADGEISGAIRQMRKAMWTDLENNALTPQLKAANAVFARELGVDYLQETSRRALRSQGGLAIFDGEQMHTSLLRALDDPDDPLHRAFSASQLRGINDFYGKLAAETRIPGRVGLAVVSSLGGGMLGGALTGGSYQGGIAGSAIGASLPMILTMMATSSPWVRESFLQLLQAGKGRVSFEALQTLTQLLQNQAGRRERESIDVTRVQPLMRPLFAQ